MMTHSVNAMIMRENVELYQSRTCST